MKPGLQRARKGGQAAGEATNTFKAHSGGFLCPSGLIFNPVIPVTIPHPRELRDDTVTLTLIPCDKGTVSKWRERRACGLQFYMKDLGERDSLPKRPSLSRLVPAAGGEVRNLCPAQGPASCRSC